MQDLTRAGLLTLKLRCFVVHWRRYPHGGCAQARDVFEQERVLLWQQQQRPEQVALRSTEADAAAGKHRSGQLGLGRPVQQVAGAQGQAQQQPVQQPQHEYYGVAQGLQGTHHTDMHHLHPELRCSSTGTGEQQTAGPLLAPNRQLPVQEPALQLLAGPASDMLPHGATSCLLDQFLPGLLSSLDRNLLLARRRGAAGGDAGSRPGTSTGGKPMSGVTTLDSAWHVYNLKLVCMPPHVCHLLHASPCPFMCCLLPCTWSTFHVSLGAVGGMQHGSAHTALNRLIFIGALILHRCMLCFAFAAAAKLLQLWCTGDPEADTSKEAAKLIDEMLADKSYVPHEQHHFQQVGRCSWDTDSHPL